MTMKISNPSRIKKAEIIVGIPSYNEEKTISHVVEQASLGLEQYFLKKKCVIINLDNNSTDKTKEVFFKSKKDIPLIYVSTEKNKQGKGYNLHNLFSMVKKLKAEVGMTFDSDLKSIQPDWIKKMAQPVFDDYDFVVPYYARHRADATITNNLVYPLIYGLLGLDIRQPIGGDFAFSNQMARHWLRKRWPKTAHQYGIDIFMTLTAFFDKMKIAQVNLGEKIHNVSNPKLGLMFFQVSETLFRMIYRGRVKKEVETKKIPLFGGKKLPQLEETEIDEYFFNQLFLDNFNHSIKKSKNILSPSVYKKLKEISKKKEKTINSDLWSKIVYDFLLEYKKTSKRLSVLEVLGYLYFGRVSSFIKETIDLSQKETENEIINQAKIFRKKRNYFIKKYK